MGPLKIQTHSSFDVPLFFFSPFLQETFWHSYLCPTASMVIYF